MANHPDNRRHFTRIPLDSEVELRCGDQTWSSRILDISLKGALLQMPEGFSADNNTSCELTFVLSEPGVEIIMQVDIAHQEEGLLGLYCTTIDLDSITHLKRMVELNIGDESLLERELGELIHG